MHSANASRVARESEGPFILSANTNANPAAKPNAAFTLNCLNDVVYTNGEWSQIFVRVEHRGNCFLEKTA
jgi:hypothetical protein